MALTRVTSTMPPNVLSTASLQSSALGRILEYVP